jgi:fibronectin-binding autotransporter adhesin
MALLLCCLAPASARAADSIWTGTSGASGTASWATADNWTGGVPSAATDAILPDPLAAAGNNSITLGGTAVANSLAVRGTYDPTAYYSLHSGTLTLSNQLLIDSAAGAFMEIGSGASVFALSGSIGAAGATSLGSLDLLDGGQLTIAGTLSLGAAGNGYIYANNGSLTVGTLDIGGLGAFDLENNASLHATTLIQSSSNSFSSVYGSTLTTTTVVLGNTVGADANEISVVENGQWNSSGPLTIGKASTGNIVSVGSGSPSVGTLTLTGSASDVVLGQNSGADGNMLIVQGLGSLATTAGALIVGQGGASNEVRVEFGGAASSATGRIGVDAGSDGNTVTLETGGRWDIADTLLVGGGGSNNQLTISRSSTLTTGGTVQVGDGSGTGNSLLIQGFEAQMTINGATSDLIIGSGGNAASATIRAGGLLEVGRNIELGSQAELNVHIDGPNQPSGYPLTVGGVINGADGARVQLFDEPEVKEFAPQMTGGLSVVYWGNARGNAETWLTADNTYTGTTDIRAGKLSIDGDQSAATGDVTVQGATLGGSGTIGGNTVVKAYGHLQPGGSDGVTLTFLGDLDLSGGASLDMELFLLGYSPRVDVGGELRLGDTTLYLPYEPLQTGAFVIADYGTLVGEFATIDTTLDSRQYYVDYDFLGRHEIAFVVIPEIDPSSFGSAFALLMGSLGFFERRPRRLLRLPAAS